jgi:hypothetical protein
MSALIEEGSKQDFKHCVLRALPARKLIGYRIISGSELRGTPYYLHSFRFTATEAIRLCSQWTQKYKQVFNIEPEWRSPLLNGS